MSATTPRTCCRRGCNDPVKKPTAKYCSVQCCAIDPERHERLRKQARRGKTSLVPMSRQLSFNITGSAVNPEAQLAFFGEGREDIPAGMARLAG